LFGTKTSTIKEEAKRRHIRTDFFAIGRHDLVELEHIPIKKRTNHAMQLSAKRSADGQQRGTQSLSHLRSDLHLEVHFVACTIKNKTNKEITHGVEP
jgi:hypothetical protein